MKIRLFVCACLVTAGLGGCQQPPAPVSTPTPAATAAAPQSGQRFDHDTLPAEVTDLSGVPLLTIANEMNGLIRGVPGGTFILLSPTNPEKGVVVVASRYTAAQLAGHPSSEIKISGKVSTTDAITSPYQSLKLATAGGKVQYILVEGALWPEETPAAGTPGGETPAAGSETPAAGTPGAATPDAPSAGETPAPDAPTAGETPAPNAPTAGETPATTDTPAAGDSAPATPGAQ